MQPQQEVLSPAADDPEAADVRQRVVLYRRGQRPETVDSVEGWAIRAGDWSYPDDDEVRPARRCSGDGLAKGLRKGQARRKNQQVAALTAGKSLNAE